MKLNVLRNARLYILYIIKFNFILNFVSAENLQNSSVVDYDDDCLETYLPKVQRHLYKDVCHTFRCTILNEKYIIRIITCKTPEIPANAVRCHLYNTANKNSLFPECCPKLNCTLTLTSDRVNVIVKFQEMNLTDVMTEAPPNDIASDSAACEQCVENENVDEYEWSPSRSVNKRDTEFEYEEDKIQAEKELIADLRKERERALGPQVEMTVWEWIAWPLTTIVDSYFKLLNIRIRTRENGSRYARVWEPNRG